MNETPLPNQSFNIEHGSKCAIVTNAIVFTKRIQAGPNLASLIAGTSPQDVILISEETCEIVEQFGAGMRFPIRRVLIKDLEEDYYGWSGNLQGTELGFTADTAYLPIPDTTCIEAFGEELTILANCGVKKIHMHRADARIELSCAGSLDYLVNRHCGSSCLVASKTPDSSPLEKWDVQLLLPAESAHYKPLGRSNYIFPTSGLQSQGQGQGYADAMIIAAVSDLMHWSSPNTYFIAPSQLRLEVARKTGRSVHIPNKGLSFAVAVAILMGVKSLAVSDELLTLDCVNTEKLRALCSSGNVSFTIWK